MTSNCVESASPTARGPAETIEITSYAEVVLASSAADALHPAFSNLFVQTEIIRERQAILCTRRPRSSTSTRHGCFISWPCMEQTSETMSYETDRLRFIGRGHTVAAPQAMSDSAALSGSEGSVLDPIVAIRCRITLDPEESATIDMVSGIGETRDVLPGAGREIPRSTSRRSCLRSGLDP